MRQGAERFAAGDFSHRLPLPDSVELASLALTLNRMAAQLAEQIAVIMQQRNEQEAILESMHEGVLALDTQERVITVNRAAEALLGVMVTQAILFRNWFSRRHCSQSSLDSGASSKVEIGVPECDLWRGLSSLKSRR